jgi:hypothetical protein
MDSIIVGVTTAISIFASLYLFALSRVSFLKKNWVEYRCNPIYMPMAGLVGQDIVKNFTQCTMKGFHDYAGFIMDPLMGEFAIVNDTLEEVGTAMHSMRGMMSTVRGGFLGIIGTVFGKIENLMSQFQYIIIRMRTLMSRVVGIMMTFVSIFTTGGETAGSVMNGPVMKTMSFLCFDSETQIKVFKGKLKNIKDLDLGEKLFDGSRVTSLYQFLGTGVQMYKLNDIIVSGEHKVKNFDGKFIKVKDHLSAVKTLPSRHLVCLNTTSNRVYTIKNVFLDFDEIKSKSYTNFKNTYLNDIFNTKGINTSTKTGLDGQTVIPLQDGFKTINNIIPGDILDNGDVIVGIAIHKTNEKTFFSMNGIIGTKATLCYKNDKVVSYEQVADECHFEPNESFLAYQLITETSTFPVLDKNENRIHIVDELQTTDSFVREIKDVMIVSH